MGRHSQIPASLKVDRLLNDIVSCPQSLVRWHCLILALETINNHEAGGSVAQRDVDGGDIIKFIEKSESSIWAQAEKQGLVPKIEGVELVGDAVEFKLDDFESLSEDDLNIDKNFPTKQDLDEIDKFLETL